MDLNICLEIANKLEAVRQYKCQNSRIVVTLAKLMLEYRILDIKYLNDLVESLVASRNQDDLKSKQPAMNLTPDILLTSDFLVHKIATWVKRLREKLFGSPAAPFQTLEEATSWIECEVAKGNPALDEEKVKALMKPLLQMGYTVGWEHLLPYPGKGGWQKIVRVPVKGRDNSLSLLHQETLSMANATGFPQSSLVLHILTNIQPLLPRVRISRHITNYDLPSGELFGSHSITLDIRAKDLTFNELRQTYNSHREILDLTKGKALNKKHWQIYQLVQKRGGPVKGNGMVAFWKSIKDEWNNLYPENKFMSFKGVKLAYDRLIVQLENRVLIKQVQNERKHNQEG